MPKTKDSQNLKCKEKYTGMKIKARNGMMMECINYINSKNLTVKFEDGTIKYKVFKNAFLRGDVGNPNYKIVNSVKNDEAKKKYIGMKVRAKNGMMMECIDYTDRHNLTIRFENGSIRTNVGRNEFIGGLVRENKKQKYIGMKVRAKNGMMMECIEYFGNKDITIKFEDGSIVYNKSIAEFLSGTVRNPNLLHPLSKKSKRENVQFTLKNGLIATVISYNSSVDIIVRLSDGTVVKTDWHSLSHGHAVGSRPPARITHLQEKYQTQYGISCEITGVNEQSYQITWEDGYKTNTTLNVLSQKRARHPILKRDKKISFIYHNYKCQFIYNDNSDYYYICSCPKCGYEEILSAKEMQVLHVCKIE